MYADLVGVDEFLGSHVLRIPNSTAGAQNVSGRETRGKARQFTTFNGRTVVVKDTWVYSNKGGLSICLIDPPIDLWTDENGGRGGGGGGGVDLSRL